MTAIPIGELTDRCREFGTRFPSLRDVLGDDYGREITAMELAAEGLEGRGGPRRAWSGDRTGCAATG